MPYEQSDGVRVEKYSAIPMWYVCKIQQEEFWQQSWFLVEPELRLSRGGVPVSYACNLMAPFSHYESIQVEMARILGANHSLYMLPSNWPEAQCLKESLIQQVLADCQESDNDLQKSDRRTSPKNMQADDTQDGVFLGN